MTDKGVAFIFHWRKKDNKQKMSPDRDHCHLPYLFPFQQVKSLGKSFQAETKCKSTQGGQEGYTQGSEKKLCNQNLPERQSGTRGDWRSSQNKTMWRGGGVGGGGREMLQDKIVRSSMGSAGEKQIDPRQIHLQGRKRERDGGVVQGRNGR